MADFVQQRHKPPTVLHRPRELIVACPPLRSSVNVARIVRAAGCCGLGRLICCGRPRIDREIARDTGDSLHIEFHRTLTPVLQKLRQEKYQLIGLEQTSGAESLYTFAFPQRAVLVIGNERHGIEPEVLELMDRVVEIPVYGLPYAHNVATAAAIAMYEYCRQYPDG